MDATNQPLLSVHDLSVTFHQPSGTSVAVDRISFEIKRGECVALVGESGSGKSVSALSILKLLPYPTASHPSGSIRFKGGELLGLSENDIRGIRGNDISIIFQEPMTSLNPLHTIESQIGEILHLHNDISGSMVRERTLDRKSTRLNSSHLVISYAVFCLKKKITRSRSWSPRPPHQPSTRYRPAAPSWSRKCVPSSSQPSAPIRSRFRPYSSPHP